jgi:hypothetical protein
MADGLRLHEPVTLDALAEHPEHVRKLSPDSALVLLARVEGLAGVLRVAAAPAPRENAPDPAAVASRGGRWLTPSEAAELCGVSRRQVYSWSRRLDWRQFTRRLSRKALRLEERGLLKWLNAQSAQEVVARLR